MKSYLAKLSITLVLSAGVVASVDATSAIRGNGDQCGQCQEGGSGEEVQHFCGASCQENEENCFEGCDHTAPVNGNCFSGHDHCGTINFALSELRQAVAAGDAVTLQKLLDENAATLTFNAARHALQIVNCDQLVTDHLQLEHDVAQLLQD